MIDDYLPIGEFARRTGIALWARATVGDGEGTRIDTPEQVKAEHPTIGVTGVRNLVRLRARVSQSMDHMLAVAADASLPVLHLDADHEIADLWFSPTDVPDWAAVRLKLMGQVEIEESCGAVSVVGDFIGRNAAQLARARSVAAGAGIVIKAMATSPLRATLFCHEDDVDALTRALHRAFRE